MLYEEEVAKHPTSSPYSILVETVTMKYLEDREMTITDVIQWILQSHIDGIDFIESNAPLIDISFEKAIQVN